MARKRQRRQPAPKQQPHAPSGREADRKAGTARRPFFEPPALNALPWTVAWPHILLVICTVLAVYGCTAPCSVALEDDGELITAVYFLGIAHPPGYPLYVLLAHLFTWIPFGSIAFNVHLTSAFFGALTCGVIWWTARALLPRHLPAYVAAFGLGFSRTFWSQAIIAEVYTLNTLLFHLMLAFCLLYLQTRRVGFLRLVALLSGLSLANHWPLITLAAPVLVLTLIPTWRSLLSQRPKEYVILSSLFALGLTPYVWMVLRSIAVPDVAFRGAIDSWPRFWFFVSRGGYASIDTSPVAGWWDKAQFAYYLLKETILQYTPLGALFAAIGLALQRHYLKNALSIGLVAGFLAGSVGIVLLLDFDYEFINRAVISVYPLIPYSIMSLWLALGVWLLAERLERAPYVHKSLLPYTLGVAILAPVLIVNMAPNNRRSYDIGRQYGMTLLNSFVPGATVLTAGDIEASLLEYLHYVENVRPDIRLLQEEGLMVSLDQRLFDPWLNVAQKHQATTYYVEHSHEPIYFVGETYVPRIPNTRYIDAGFYIKLDRSTLHGPTYEVRDGFLNLFREVVRNQYRDAWTRVLREFTIARMVSILTRAVYVESGKQNIETYGADLEAGSRHFLGRFMMISVLNRFNAAPIDHLLELSEGAEQLVDDTISPQNHALLYLLKSQLLARTGRYVEAYEAANRTVEIYPTSRALAERRKMSILLNKTR